jgi:hypothetical protein
MFSETSIFSIATQCNLPNEFVIVTTVKTSQTTAFFGPTYTEAVCEQGGEESSWTEEGWSDGRAERVT